MSEIEHIVKIRFCKVMLTRWSKFVKWMTTDMLFENYIVIYAIIEVYPHAMDARVRADWCDKSLPSPSLFTVYWSMIKAHLHGVNSMPLKFIDLW